MKIIPSYLIVFVFILNSILSFSQNLIINPSMEDTSLNVLPTNSWNNTYVPGTRLAPNWVTPTSASADYYNSHRSTLGGLPLVKAHHGEGRIGLIAGCANVATRVGYKEYAMGRLSSPMERDKYYKITFYVALDPTCKYAMDSLGMYITSRRIATTDMRTLPFKPQIIQDNNKVITANDGWVKISGLYLAGGGEQYVILGTFSRKSRILLENIGEKTVKKSVFSKVQKFAYYYFDDIEVEEYDTTRGFDLNKEEIVVKSKAERFLFLVDVSQSMAADGKLDSLKNALKSTYRSLPKNAEISIVTFSDASKLILPFTRIDQIVNIEQSLDSLTTTGNTLAGKSIEFVYKYLDQHKIEGKTSVFFFTDGIFELPPSSGALIKSHFQNDGITFSTFQFGDRVNNDLNKIASQTQGTYVGNSDNNLSEKLSSEMYTKEKVVKEKEPIERGKSKGGLVVLRYALISTIAALFAIRYI